MANPASNDNLIRRQRFEAAKRWLDPAVGEPGDEIVYHISPPLLATIREVVPLVEFKARMWWTAYEKGLVHLVQKRNENGRTFYIAKKRSIPYDPYNHTGKSPGAKFRDWEQETRRAL